MTTEVCLGNDSILHCPHCAGTNLHHIRSEVYNRASEDDYFGTMSITDDAPPECVKDMKFETSFSNNPSTRRNGIRIFFYCEWCPEVSVLDIIQHKGSTYVVWESDNG